MKKNCEVCSSEFETKGNGRYCSTKCFNIIYNKKESARNLEKMQKRVLIVKSCEICGTNFEAKMRGGGAKTCSDKCSKILDTGIDHEALKDRVCLICSSPMSNRNAAAKYCSRKCNNKQKNINRKNKRHENKKICQEEIKPKFTKEIKCLICNTIFVISSANHQYCSDKCYHEHVKEYDRQQYRKDRNNYLKSDKYFRDISLKFIKKQHKRILEEIEYQKHTKTCPECNNTFFYKGMVKWCSEECKVEGIRRRDREAHRATIQYMTKCCMVCFAAFKTSRKTQCCCSKECTLKNVEILISVKREINDFIQNEKRILKEKENTPEKLAEKEEQRLEYDRVRSRLRRQNEKDKMRKQRNLRNKKIISTPEEELKFEISKYIRFYLYSKSNINLKYVNYNINELRESISNIFKIPGNEWMNWNNWGLYKIGGERKICLDHIIPQSYFKFINDDQSINEKEIHMCWSIKNLQPICSKTNLKKGNKITFKAIQLSNEFGINLEDRANSLKLKYQTISDEELNKGL